MTLKILKKKKILTVFVKVLQNCYMCSKYLQGVAFNSEKSRSNLLRSISNQIATLYSYNIYFIALSLMSSVFPKQNYMTLMLTTIIFFISPMDFYC